MHRFTGKIKKADRARWIRAINRADPKQPWKLLEQTPAQVVCSEHIVDGAPSVANPDPSIFPITKKHKRAESDLTARKARALARDGKKPTIVRETHHEEPVPDADVEETMSRTTPCCDCSNIEIPHCYSPRHHQNSYNCINMLRSLL